MVMIALGLFGAYVGFVLFVARMMSDKWHPDGGRKDEDR